MSGMWQVIGIQPIIQWSHFRHQTMYNTQQKDIARAGNQEGPEVAIIAR